MEPVPGEIAQRESMPAMPETRTPSRLECVGGVIVSPVKTFEHLASHPQWLIPFILLILWVLVGFVVTMAVSMATIFSGTGGPFGVDAQEAMPYISVFIGIFFGGIQLVMAVIGTTAVFFAMAGTLYVTAHLFKHKPRFYALASTLAYAEFVPRLVGTSLNEFLPLMTGNFSMMEEKLPTGVLQIFPYTDFPAFLEPLLARIELFHLWSFALVAISLRFTLGVSKNRAILVTAIYWAFCIAAITAVFSIWEFASDALLGFS